VPGQISEGADMEKHHQVEFDLMLTIHVDGIKFHVTGEGVEVIKLHDDTILRHRHVKTLAKINSLLRDICAGYSKAGLAQDKE
jgi:hypothetical protein